MNFNMYALPGVLTPKNEPHRQYVKKPTISRILDVIEKTYGKTYKDLNVKSKYTALCVPRQIAMYWMFRLCPEMSQGEIGAIFWRDRITARWAYKIVKNRRYDPKVMYYYKKSFNAFLELKWSIEQNQNYN